MAQHRVVVVGGGFDMFLAQVLNVSGHTTTLTLKWFEDSGVYWNMSLSSKYKNY